MKTVKLLKEEIIHTLQSYEMVYVQMTEQILNNSVTIIFDDKTHSSKLKRLNHSLKQQQLKAAWSFCPETWQLAVTITV